MVDGTVNRIRSKRTATGQVAAGASLEPEAERPPGQRVAGFSEGWCCFFNISRNTGVDIFVKKRNCLNSICGAHKIV